MESIFLRFFNRDRAQKNRHSRFSHYAHVILHIENPWKNIQTIISCSEKNHPTCCFELRFFRKLWFSVKWYFFSLCEIIKNYEEKAKIMIEVWWRVTVNNSQIIFFVLQVVPVLGVPPWELPILHPQGL